MVVLLFWVRRRCKKPLCVVLEVLLEDDESPDHVRSANALIFDDAVLTSGDEAAWRGVDGGGLNACPPIPCAGWDGMLFRSSEGGRDDVQQQANI